MMEMDDNKNENVGKGEIDYAILKSVISGVKTLGGLGNILQMRPIIIEKHVYLMVKEGFLIFQLDSLDITQKGNDAIDLFEKENSETTWRPIEEFIINAIKQKKEQKIKTYKILDKILLASIMILIILIIYFGIFQ